MTYIDTIRRHFKNASATAIIAVVIFLGVLFSFATSGNLTQQTAQTALLNTTEEADTTELHNEQDDYVVGAELEKMTPLPTQQVDTETLWLARAIYSETKRPQEQELVAWTLRNRVETRYRGNASYEEAVLDPYQYSAFIKGTKTHAHYTSLTASSQAEGFQNAVAIAKQVKEAPAQERPFSQTTRHFFSEQSMQGGRHPNWAQGQEPVVPARPLKLEAKRFRFYENIS